MTLSPAFDTKTRLLAQLTSTAVAAPLDRNGEPGTCVKAPLLPMANTPTASMDLRPTTRKRPLGLTFIPSENAPTLNGESGISAKAPVARSIAKTWTRVLTSSVEKRNLASGLAASEKFVLGLAVPAGNGEPTIAANCPVSGSIRNALMVPSWLFAAYRKLLPPPLAVAIFPALTSLPPPLPPVANGEPASSVKLPSAFTWKAETVFLGK